MHIHSTRDMACGETCVHALARDNLVLSARERDALGDLDACPCTGSGVHRFILAAASRLVREGSKDKRIHEILRRATRKCGRDVPFAEIQSAIAGSRSYHGKSASGPRAEGLPKPVLMDDTQCREIRARILEKSPVKSLEQLTASGSSLPDSAAPVLDHLFSDNALVLVKEQVRCAGRVLRYGEIRETIGRYPLFCPNPARDFTATRESDGKTSPSIRENFPLRKHIVVEIDNAEREWDRQAAIIGHIGTMLPLLAVTYSGNKSLHAIYRFDPAIDGDVLKFLLQASHILGIDPHPTQVASCPTRMPYAIRPDTRRVQTLHFFNPTPTKFV